MTDEKAGSSRRDFLKLAAAGAPAAAIAAVSSGGTAEAALPEGASVRLRRTEHVEKYLESARF
jgi:hypothetical protein